MRIRAKRSTRPTFSYVAALFVLAACGGGDPPGPTNSPSIVSVTIAQASLQLVGAGATGTLTATVTSSDGVVSAPTVTWTSNATNVATVSGSSTSATVTAVAVGTAAVIASSGGKSDTVAVVVTPAGSIAISGEPLTIARGSSGSANIAVTRTSYTGDVALTFAGAPAGVTGTFGPRQPAGNTDTYALTLTVVSAVAAGTYPITIQASGVGVATASTTIQLTVTAPSFALTANPTSLAITQGGSAASSNLTIGRSSYTGAVQLSATSPVAGLTVGITPTSTTGTSATVTVTAVQAVAPGTYQVAITGTAPSLADQTANLSIVVDASGGDVVLDLSTCFDPAGWFAVQDGASAPWQRVVGVNGVFRFDASAARVNLVYSSAHKERARWTSVVQTSASLAPVTPVDQLCERKQPAPGPQKTLVASIAPGSESPDGLLFGSFGALPSFFSVGSVGQVKAPDTGIHDLTLVRSAPDTAPRMFIRRGINTTVLPDGASLGAPIDFFGSESAAMPSATVAVTGQGAGGVVAFSPFALIGKGCVFLPLLREVLVPNLLIAFGVAGDAYSNSPNRLYAPFAVTSFPTAHVGGYAEQRNLFNPSTISAIPSSLWQSGDVSGVVLSWFDARAFDPFGEVRTVVETYQSLGNGSLTLPSGMPTITPTVLAGNGYRRLRFQFQLPSDLDDAGVVRYQGADQNIFSMRVTSALAGGRSMDFTSPDFAGLPGWDDAYGPHGTVTYEIRGEKNTRATACSPGRTATSARYGPA